jgi:3-methyladenine DNA glycosylase AlkD
LLDSEWHEARLCGIFILNQKFTRSIKSREEKQWVDLYLSMTHRINNWDLVDSSAHIILGRWLETRDRGILYELAGSPSLWENRIAVVATLHFIRRNDLKDILRLSEKMLPHPHDLMHKATGWMLRESWKQDPAMIEKFLRTFSGRMPRTMLRYAIEKMPEERRRDFLQAGKGK